MSDLIGPETMTMLVESSVEALAVADADGSWIYMNAAGLNILGLTAEQAVSRSMFREASDLSDGAWSDGSQRASAAVVYRPDGARRAVEFVATPYRANGSRYTAVTFRDVTDLAVEREQLSAFAESAHRTAYRESLRGTLHAIAAQMLQVTGMSLVHIQLFDPDDVASPVALHGFAGPLDDLDEFVGLASEIRRRGAQWASAEAIRTRRLVIRRHRRREVLDDPLWSPLHPFFRSFDWDDLIAAPLLIGTRSVGAVTGYCPTGSSLSGSDLVLLEAMARQAAVVIDSARQFLERTNQAELVERHRIARDLHDTISQQLFSITLHSQTAQLAAEQAGTDQTERIVSSLSAVTELAEAALADMRDVIFRLYPAALAEDGLVQTLRRHAESVTRREGLPVTVLADEEDLALAPIDAEVAYRIAVEAITNVVKHARAQHCTVRITRAAGAPLTLEVQVADDGVGMPERPTRSGSFGLRVMRERAERLGGTLTISDGRPGTVVTTSLPRVLAAGSSRGVKTP